MGRMGMLWVGLALALSISACGDDGSGSGGAGSDSAGLGASCVPGELVLCACDVGTGSTTCDAAGVITSCFCGDSDVGGSGGMSQPGSGGMQQAGSGGTQMGAGGAEVGSGGAGGTPPGDSGAFPAVASFGSNGPFPTFTADAVGPGSAFTIHRPSMPGVNPEGGAALRHPVITWGNGTGSTPSSYAFLLSHLASHGFIVIASNSTQVGSGVEMLQGVDWVISEDSNASSPMFGAVDTTKIGATGHSQGGFGTMQAANDPRITAIAPIQGASARGITLHGPALLLSGSMDTTVTPASVRSAYDSLSGVPLFYGELSTADHTNWIFDGFTGNSGYTAPVTAWLRAHLMGDDTARAPFYGASCGLCTDAAWITASKGL